VSGDEVIILGAGFSHAASEHMPLQKELGQSVLDRLRADGNRDEHVERLSTQLERALSDDDTASDSPGFESWLARLAEDQPYLSQRENLERRALFSQVSEVMWEVMVERQAAVLTPGEDEDPSLEPKEWLYDIVSLFHQRGSTVITLNYDNLVEHGAASSFLWGASTTPWTESRAVRVDDLFDGLPPFLPPMERVDEVAVSLNEFQPRPRPRPAPTVPTFRLLKLHGSLSWFWIPNDPSGVTLAAWNVAELGRGLKDKEARRRDLPGREPFLVPPTTSKASYFETTVTRELWRRAYEALAVAKRVVLVGYSLPAADSTFLGLLADTIVGREIEVVVVNPVPDLLKEQLVRLGVEGAIPVVDDVKTWVEQEINRDAKQLVDRLCSWAREVPGRAEAASLSVGWMVRYAPTSEVYSAHTSERSDELVLRTRFSEEEGSSKPCTLADVIPLLEGIARISADVGGRKVTMTQLEPSPPNVPGVPPSVHLFPVGRPQRG
jgi:hypothetical protein